MLEELAERLNGPLLALWGPFAILILCAFGFPMPEDIVLVTAGFLAGKNGASVWPPIIITYIGIMAGDSIIYFLGRNFGPRILKSKFGKKMLSDKTQKKAEEALEKHGIWVNFFGRFIPGGRTAIFFTSGSLNFRFWKFFMMDGIAALISAPAFVGLGFWAGKKFNENFDEINGFIHQAQIYVLAGVGILAAFALLYIYLNNSKKKTNTK